MKVWIVSMLLCAAFTLQITGAAVISPKEAAEIPPENFPEISPGNIIEIPPEEAAEISPEEAAEISPEEAAEIFPEEAAEISPEEAAEISPEEAAEIYSEEAEVAEYEQNLLNGPLDDDMVQESDPLDSVLGRSVICPPGWFRHGARCFLLVKSGYTWLNAETHCVNNQASLASVQSPSEYNFLQSLLTVSGYSAAWIGAYNFLGTWMWKDNTGFYYTNWQSQSSVSSYPCAYMRSSGGWSNTNCASGYVFFCAMNPSTC
uniref:C-type lectin domain-containing protein n=1 Tax=Astyanax mexicanus TaxID=7994 RepID=A0A8B9KMY5_ASTMX